MSGDPDRALPVDHRRDFEAGLLFELDAFQLESMDAWDEGASLLVSAPTVRPSFSVLLYSVLAPCSPPAAGMFLGTMAGLPGMWRP